MVDRALGPGLALPHAVERPEEVLDVVAVLVAAHVWRRERSALGAEPRLELVEEVEVDVDGPVGRAVEGADLRAGEAAAGLHRAGEEHGLRRPIGPVAPLEGVRPERLQAVDDADDAAVLARVRILLGPAVADRLARRLAGERLLVELLERPRAATAAGRVDAEEQRDDDDDQAEPAAADREPTPTDGAATADIAHLRRIEPGATAKAHGASLCLPDGHPKRVEAEA